MKSLYSLISGVFVGTTLATPALAQITVDGTTNTNLTPLDNGIQIDDGDRAGSNLFHSFSEFSVLTGSEAFFNNASDIVNIFSRVTGGNISNIDGLLRANGTANLFMINPAGIIFSENASLQIGGSFYGTSADSIIFPDGEFSATDLDNPPLITINAPLGLGIRENPGDIVNRSAADGVGLSVSEGENISLIGGNVNIQNGGIVFAPGGRVELGGLIETGIVNFNDDGSLAFPENLARGDVSLIDSSIVAVFSGGEGSIGVNAANLELSSGSRFLGGIRGGLGSVDAQAGDIVIDATDSVVIDGQGDSNTGIFANVGADSIGNAGNLDITTSSLTIQNSAVILLNTIGEGDAGNININANDSVLFDNNVLLSTGALDPASDSANAGDINITTGSLTASNDADLLSISTQVLGTGADIIINAEDTVSFSNASDIGITSAGGGSLTINAKNFELTSGSNIFAGIAPNVVSSEAQAGDIIISTTEDVLIDGDGAGVQTTTSIANNNFGVGNAGNLTINARNISLFNGGAITSISNGIGNTGDINLTATDNITLDGILQSEDNSPSGQTGISNSLIDLGNNLSSIDEVGIPGTIDITAKNLSITGGAAIQSLINTNANSGDININVQENIIVDGTSEALQQDGITGTTSSGIISLINDEGLGDSGDITISANSLSVTNGANINTDNFGIGNAGDINVNSRTINIGGQGNVFTETIINDGRTFRTASTSGITSNVISSIDLGPDGTLAQGNGGNITINTDSLSVFDGGSISVDVGGVGDSGNIIINATENVNLEGNAVNFIDGEPANLFSTISSDVTNNSIGNSGNVEINTAKLSVINGAEISASTFGEGNAGNLKINATDSIELSGDPTVEKISLIVSNVNETASGNSGEVNIETGRLTVNEGSQLLADTFGEGNAGNLKINATDSIEVSGIRSFISAGVNEQATGNSGNLNIQTGQLDISDNGSVTVESLGIGESGNLVINANSVSLENNARINAATPVGDGGSISLNVTEDIALRDNSFISARALEDANGGNLDINARFILGFPSKGNGNDIIATAERGNGGDININARQIFNLQEGKAIDSDGNFFPNNSNDIDASSQAQGLDGTVAINTPDIDPLRGAVELPTNPVSADTVAQDACSASSSSDRQNTFIVKGKGGIPPVPTATFFAEPLLTDSEPIQSTLSPDNNTNKPTDPYYIPANIQPWEMADGELIYPARGIVKTPDGRIILTVYPTDGQNTRTPHDSLGCS